VRDEKMLEMLATQDN
jgi:hypothetical protein